MRKRSFSSVMNVRSTVLVRSNFTTRMSIIIVICTPLRLHMRHTVGHSYSSHRLVVGHVQDRVDSRRGHGRTRFMVIGSNGIPLVPRILRLVSLLSRGVTSLSKG